MATTCYKTITLKIGSGEATDALIRCPSTGDFYYVGYTSHTIYRVDSSTLTVVDQTDPLTYYVPAWAQLFYEPNGGYIYTNVQKWDPFLMLLRSYPKLDPTTMVPSGPWGTLPFYAYGTSTRNTTTGHLYTSGASRVVRYDPTTDSLTHNQTVNYYQTIRQAYGALYLDVDDTVWFSCRRAGGGGLPYTGVILAKGTDLTWWLDAMTWPKYGVMPDSAAGEAWPDWSSPSDPGMFPTIGAMAYVPSANRIVVGWEHTLAYINVPVMDSTVIYTGVYTANLGGFMVDCILHTDGMLYCHLDNGNVVVWNPATDTIVHTYTGFQPMSAVGFTWPLGNYPGSYSRMAFDATGTHLYVSSYGVTQVF